MTIDLNALTLARGSHGSRAAGVCLLEAVAWWAGKTHTDHPSCVSPVLGACGRSLNDVLPEATRQQLKPYIPLLPGTADDGKDETRRYIALDWLIRTYTPAWLDLAGFASEAAALRDFRRIADFAAAQAVRSHVLAGRDKADAARDAAGEAARAAAWAAARAAAGEAAGAAARAAAGTAAGEAAWAAAREAAWAAAWDADAAGEAAWDAAGEAAWDAAWDAAGEAAWEAAGEAARAAAGEAAGEAAWDAAAAGEAAGDKLAPTVDLLRQSAIALYGVLITGEWPGDG